jgi:DNA-damage-inducible protein D
VSEHIGNSRPDFDSIRQTNPYGQEYWSARDLMPLLGYTSWQKFDGVIGRAKQACEQLTDNPNVWFSKSSKQISSGKGAVREIRDYHLNKNAV